MLYFLLKNLKNNVKMVLIFKGVIWLILIKFLSNVIHLYTVGIILEYVVSWGLHIRNALFLYQRFSFVVPLVLQALQVDS